MKHRSPKIKLFLLAGLLIAGGMALFQTALSSAKSADGDKPPATTSQEKGTVVARLKDYDPKIEGYSFRNYGSKHDNENDLDAGDMITIFGAENVCESGSTAKDCVLYEPAEEWLEQQFKMLSHGHCDGLALTSLAFWLEHPFEGKKTPADWQSGAKNVSDLQLSDALLNYVARIHVLQSLAEVYDFRRQIFNRKPSEILHLLMESMKDNSQDRMELLIYLVIDGRLAKGHAIAPYEIEDMGDGEYHIHVYDSNFPGLDRYVELNAKEETWRYHTAANPDQTANDYVGDANSHSLSLQNLSARELEVYGCPFCPDANQRASLHHAGGIKKTKKEQVGFTMDGEGEYMITDPNGKHIGYDFAKNRFVNEIPEADVIPVTGGLGKNVPAQYNLPRLQATKPYAITVGGKGIDHEVDADMEMTGPGFLVGFEDLLVDPGETLTMTISPNGRELSFTASADGETPSVFITIGTAHKDPSYEFEIGGIKLTGGKSVTMKLDLEKEKLFFKDNDAERDLYDVKVTRVNPDGTEDYYENDDLDLAKKTDNYEMDFSKWDGKGDMCFEDDENGNGFDDDECTKEPNEKKKPAKPGAALNYFDHRQPIAMLLRF
jgi:hypothetical protein